MHVWSDLASVYYCIACMRAGISLKKRKSPLLAPAGFAEPRFPLNRMSENEAV